MILCEPHKARKESSYERHGCRLIGKKCPTIFQIRNTAGNNCFSSHLRPSSPGVTMNSYGTSLPVFDQCTSTMK